MAKTTPLLHQPLGHDPSSASILVGPTYQQRHMAIRFAEDSALEGNGFELSVPSARDPGFDLRTLQVQGDRDPKCRTRLTGSRQFQGLAVFSAKGAGVDPLGPIRQPTSRQGPEKI